MRLELIEAALPNAGTTAAWRIWGYFVEIFAGNFVALACVVTAIAAGCLAMVVFRSCGWRVATAASALRGLIAKTQAARRDVG